METHKSSRAKLDTDLKLQAKTFVTTPHKDIYEVNRTYISDAEAGKSQNLDDKQKVYRAMMERKLICTINSRPIRCRKRHDD
jgi:hypothetical protein